MSEVIFHVNTPDPLAYTCRLLRKALGRYAKVVVSGDGDVLGRLDTSLWTFAAQSFVPHCWSDADKTMLRASPVVLGTADSALPPAPLLVRLNGTAAAEFDRFPKIIEVVGQNEPALREARGRWKYYLAQGHSVTHHDIGRTEFSHG